MLVLRTRARTVRPYGTYHSCNSRSIYSVRAWRLWSATACGEERFFGSPKMTSRSCAAPDVAPGNKSTWSVSVTALWDHLSFEYPLPIRETLPCPVRYLLGDAFLASPLPLETIDWERRMENGLLARQERCLNDQMGEMCTLEGVGKVKVSTIIGGGLPVQRVLS